MTNSTNTPDRVRARLYWDAWYRKLKEPNRMGRIGTYRLAVGWVDLEGCVLEDWGGGTAYARRFVNNAQYRVVDGSPSQWNRTPVELTTYRSRADCILIRHVLEHNRDWRLILENAVASFQRRMALVLYQPPPPDRTLVVSKPSARVIEHAIALTDIEEIAGPAASVTPVGKETVLLYER